MTYFIYIYYLQVVHAWHFTWKVSKRDLPSIKNFLSHHGCVRTGIYHFHHNSVFFIPHSEMDFFFFLNNMKSSCSQASPTRYCLLLIWRPPLSLVVQTAVDILPLEWLPPLLNELLSTTVQRSLDSFHLLPSFSSAFGQGCKIKQIYLYLSFRTPQKRLRITMISFPCENIPSVVWQRRNDKRQLTTHHFSEHDTFF